MQDTEVTGQLLMKRSFCEKKITDDLYEVKKSKYSLDEGSEDKEDTSKHPSFDSSQALRLGWGHLVKK